MIQLISNWIDYIIFLKSSPDSGKIFRNGRPLRGSYFLNTYFLNCRGGVQLSGNCSCGSLWIEVDGLEYNTKVLCGHGARNRRIRESILVPRSTNIINI